MPYGVPCRKCLSRRAAGGGVGSVQANSYRPEGGGEGDRPDPETSGSTTCGTTGRPFASPAGGKVPGAGTSLAWRILLTDKP